MSNSINLVLLPQKSTLWNSMYINYYDLYSTFHMTICSDLFYGKKKEDISVRLVDWHKYSETHQLGGESSFFEFFAGFSSKSSDSFPNIFPFRKLLLRKAPIFRKFQINSKNSQNFFLCIINKFYDFAIRLFCCCFFCVVIAWIAHSFKFLR